MKKTIQSINPFTQEVNAEFELLSREEITAKIRQANTAYKIWKTTSSEHKKSLFLKLADVIDMHKEEMAELEMTEMWMLYSYSFAWIGKTSDLIRWFANNFEAVLAKKEFETQGVKVIQQYDPIGVIFWVAPWNFPFNQVLRAAVPNILSGNTQIYKHASNVPMCWEMIEKLFLEAGFPVWVYQNIIVSSRDSEYIMEHSEIAWMNLTGSEWAGKALGSLAWKVLKPSVLELGGNDAFIVADTDNIKTIAQQAAFARVSNNGQKCNSSKRFIVRENIYDEFVEHFVATMENLTIGDPYDMETDIWPLAKKDLLDEIDAQVQKSIAEWAKLLTGWKKISIAEKWFFYVPTILWNVTPDITSYKEEVFGPVASIIKVQDLEEAIKIANDSDFWLCGCVYWDNVAQCIEIASQIETGMVFINSPAASKASLAFGGVKKSGYWKENGEDGLKAFTNKKVIVY